MREIEFGQAKATLSAVVDEAVKGEPTAVNRHGRKEAVVLSFEEFERLSNVPSLGQLLAFYPGEGEDLIIRGKGARPVDL